MLCCNANIMEEFVLETVTVLLEYIYKIIAATVLLEYINLKVLHTLVEI